MSSFLGVYTFPYNGGKFAIQVFSVSGSSDVFNYDAGFVQEGSLVIHRKNGTYSSMGSNTQLENGQYIRPTTDNNNSWGIYNGATGSDGTTFGLSFNGDGFSPSAIGVDEAGNYYIWCGIVYQSNAPTVYEYEITEPSTGKAGYYVLTRKRSGRFDFSTRIADQTLIDYLSANLKPFLPTTDPYEQGGGSGTGGGSGNFDGTGDNVDIPSLPTFSAVDAGFITLFNPSAGELHNLANYMWGNSFDLETWKKIFADPMDAILGLSIVPVAVPNGGSSVVTVGNISTGISMNKANTQYVAIDCGTLNVNEYWGAYLDYDPYTKAEIYLPYIGTHPLAVDDIMGKSVHVVYHVDILSGACCAYIKCGGSVLYSFVGQCSCSIPITGKDWTNVVNGALSIAASIGTMVATGGASAPMAATTIASTAVNSMKPNVEKSGSMGGMGGMLGVQTPYLILTRPRQALPANQNVFMGYPSFITMSLGDCSGYTEIESVHLENIPATEQELSEIESLLKGGVIL